jgi:uroporphyrinogen decarboxylase
LNQFDFPTADWIDYSMIEVDCQQLDGYAIVTGTPGVLDFINGISHSRGLERVLMDIGTGDPVYLALLERKFEYHYMMTERTLQASGGLIDIVQTGEDLGTQQGLLISPAKFGRLFAPKYRAFFDMVHSYSARVMMHCCGSCRRLLPMLIDLGLDILDVVQVSAKDMDIQGLCAEFGRDLSFCGTMCVQTTLPESSAEEIAREVALRQKLFADGGLILGPTHLIQPDTPLENILAMYSAAGALAG